MRITLTNIADRALTYCRNVVNRWKSWTQDPFFKFKLWDLPAGVYFALFGPDQEILDPADYDKAMEQYNRTERVMSAILYVIFGVLLGIIVAWAVTGFQMR